MASQFPYPLRFVVVDDNEEIRRLVGTLLQLRHGWELVGEASDGVTAVDLVSELQPDVVIMDIEMPRLNGIEATKEITSRVPQSIVIGFSTYTDATICAAMKEAGSAAYVPKDKVFDLPSVIEQVIQSPNLT
jgi:DNA-binding NarL/FixJ family response regulator